MKCEKLKSKEIYYMTKRLEYCYIQNVLDLFLSVKERLFSEAGRRRKYGF